MEKPFHSSKVLDNWSFVLRLTPDESWLLTRGEAWQIVYQNPVTIYNPKRQCLDIESSIESEVSY